MANEIKLSVSMECSKGTFKLPRVGQQVVQVTQNGYGGSAPGQIVVGALGVDLDLTSLDTPGWLWMKNLDGYQTVKWGVNDGGMRNVGIMKPGEPGCFRIDPTVTLRFEIDAATEDSGSTSSENQAKVQIYVLED
jgi:hypothetical protein